MKFCIVTCQNAENTKKENLIFFSFF